MDTQQPQGKLLTAESTETEKQEALAAYYDLLKQSDFNGSPAAEKVYQFALACETNYEQANAMTRALVRTVRFQREVARRQVVQR